MRSVPDSSLVVLEQLQVARLQVMQNLQKTSRTNLGQDVFRWSHVSYSPDFSDVACRLQDVFNPLERSKQYDGMLGKPLQRWRSVGAIIMPSWKVFTGKWRISCTDLCKIFILSSMPLLCDFWKTRSCKGPVRVYENIYNGVSRSSSQEVHEWLEKTTPFVPFVLTNCSRTNLGKYSTFLYCSAAVQ